MFQKHFQGTCLPTAPSQRLALGSCHLAFSKTFPSLQKSHGILEQSVQAEQTASAKGKKQGSWKERGVPGEQRHSQCGHTEWTEWTGQGMGSWRQTLWDLGKTSGFLFYIKFKVLENFNYLSYINGLSEHYINYWNGLRKDKNRTASPLVLSAISFIFWQ